MDEALKEEFVNEVRIMSQVNHKHIVRLVGACLKPPNMCMVMQLCSITLFSYLHGESHFNITEKEKVRILVSFSKRQHCSNLFRCGSFVSN